MCSNHSAVSKLLAGTERVNFIAGELFLCAPLNPNECTLNTTNEYSQNGGRLATQVPVSYESRWTTMTQ